MVVTRYAVMGSVTAGRLMAVSFGAAWQVQFQALIHLLL
jgi:hypothetical protein